jgi:HD superfamily phosphohydrolase YqeK
MAQLIGYQDLEKAYLAGLLHDLGILVNSLIYTKEYRRCFQHASGSCISLDKAENEDLGFTHCESGKILAEQWRIPSDLAEAIEYHHNLDSSQRAGSLGALVHLSDLLCRVRDLGYGYYEVMGIDFAGDAGWAVLIENYPRLRNIDLARLSLDVEASMGEIVALVDTVFAVH